eukprot:g911.t1
MRGLYGGHRIVGRRSLFSEDGKVIATAGDSALFVYSTFTSKTLARLTNYQINSFNFVPKRNTKLCILTRNGLILIWDYLTRKIEITKKLGIGFSTLVDMVVSSLDNSILVSAMDSTGNNNGRIIRLHLPNLELDQSFSINDPSGCNLFISPSGKYLCVLPLHGATQGVVLQTMNYSIPTGLKFPHPVNVACFAPNDRFLVVGCVTGKILLYSDIERSMGVLNTHTKMPSTLHWHASAVTAIEFSSDSHYLFSIGEEGVLVSWRLRDLHKSFVPRIGLNALDLVIHPQKESQLLVALQSNSFKIIDQANYKATLAVYGMSPSPGNLPFTGKEACLQPLTGHLAIRATNCSLQFYDLARDKHIYKLQVIPRMDVSRTKYKTEQMHKSFEPCLQHFVFNKSGTVLVTVTIRSRLIESELKTDIRFFDTDSVDRKYELNSEILDPHKGDIAALCYSPVDDVAVSTSRKGKFKIWTPCSRDKQSTWRCKTIGSYKDLPLGECCFSSDGSVLAIAHPLGVVLWDPITLVALGEVYFPDRNKDCHIQCLEFVPESDYLVACDSSSSLLVVWNLQTLAIHWASSISADQLIMDPSSQKFAVIIKNEPIENGIHGHQGNGVVVFDAMSSTPQAVYSDFPQSISNIHFALPNTSLFIAGRQMENGVKHTHAPLVVIYSSRQYSIETETGTLSQLMQDEIEFDDINELPSSIERAFGGGGVGVSTRPEEDVMDLDATHEDRVVLNVTDLSKLPSHALPSVSMLCSNLLDQIIDKSGRT